VHILLLSAYDAPSHRYWRQGLERYCQSDQFTCLRLPPRHFSWRIRGNSLSWAGNARDTLIQGFDLIMATSQVDLSSLRGMVPVLTSIPTILYFHENQFAYPRSGHEHASLEPQIVNLYAALCAEQLVFNSAWNRDSFLHGVSQLLARLPDHVPAGLPELLAKKARVLPVPLHRVGPIRRKPGSVLQLLWNHRWEYDKGPDILLALIEQCLAHNLPVRFHVVGQQFKRQAPTFTRIASLLAANPGIAGECGYIQDPQRYQQLLARADVVLSTALHEFQGLAVLEAVAQGCLPLVPDRLSYPEFFPARFRYPSRPGCPQQEAHGIVARLQRLLAGLAQGEWPEPPDIAQYSWARLGPGYRALMRRCAADGLRSDWQ
jgi:glycosyltransferase involved in cell wall biosynthesis